MLSSVLFFFPEKLPFCIIYQGCHFLLEVKNLNLLFKYRKKCKTHFADFAKCSRLWRYIVTQVRRAEARQINRTRSGRIVPGEICLCAEARSRRRSRWRGRGWTRKPRELAWRHTFKMIQWRAVAFTLMHVRAVTADKQVPPYLVLSLFVQIWVTCQFKSIQTRFFE